MLAMCSECQCESQRRLYVAWKWLIINFTNCTSHSGRMSLCVMVNAL